MSRFRLVLILCGYFVFALLFTYPLLFHLNDSLVGKGLGDGFLYIWNIDTFWHEILQGHNPFFTQRIFYPLGANLMYHTYAPVLSLLGVFFQGHLIVFLNCVVIVSLALAAFAMYHLIVYLTKSALAAGIGGLLYAFSPIMMSFVESQHYFFVIAAIYLPLGVLFLVKFFETKQQRNILYLACCYWLSLLTDYYTTILFLLILAAVACSYVLVQAFKNKYSILFTVIKLRIPKLLQLVFLTIVIPTFLLVLFFARDTFSNGTNFGGISNFAAYCNTNLAGFLTPSEITSESKSIIQTLLPGQGMPKHFDTPSYFLGFGIFCIALAAFWEKRKHTYTIVFASVFVFIVALSLGTAIRIGNATLLRGMATPFYWFAKIPPLNFIDCPIRFSIGTQLAMVVVISVLLAALLKAKSFHKHVAPIVLGVFFVLEYGVIKFPLSPVTIPAVYKELSHYKDDFSTLELPSGIAESKRSFGFDSTLEGLHARQHYWQTLHKKPKISGYISRVPNATYAFYENSPIIADIFTMTSTHGTWPGKTYKDDEVRTFINTFNLGYIVIAANPRHDEYERVIDQLFARWILQKTQQEGFTLYVLDRNGAKQ